jgi:hypothetical protein
MKQIPMTNLDLDNTTATFFTTLRRLLFFFLLQYRRLLFYYHKCEIIYFSHEAGRNTWYIQYYEVLLKNSKYNDVF